MVSLRDFVYLDWDRVRSLAAQLFRGIPEQKEVQTGHDVSASVGGESSLLGLVKAEASGDYRYYRSQNETRSLHHQVYTLVEDELKDRGFLTCIDSEFDFADWREDLFHDGQLVRVVGLIRVIDYEYLCAKLDKMEMILRVLQKSEESTVKKAKVEGAVSGGDLEAKRQEHAKQLKELRDLNVGEMAKLLRELYGGAIRVKVLPSRGHPNNVFVGTGTPDWFHDSASSLVQKYGYEVDAGWVSLGQINLSASNPVAALMPTGNKMEDDLEKVALATNDLVTVASGVKFPAVSYTPLSIYRVCQNGSSRDVRR